MGLLGASLSLSAFLRHEKTGAHQGPDMVQARRRIDVQQPGNLFVGARVVQAQPENPEAQWRTQGAALGPERWMSLVMLIVSEFGFAFGVLVYNIMQLSMRQRVCPPRLLGRMNASIRFVVWGVMPIAALASGLLAENLGLVPTLWIGLGGSLVFVAPVLFSPLWGMRRLPDEVHGA